MILVDTNLLVYATIKTSDHHERAVRWLDDSIGSDIPVGMPWHSLIGFLRISTSRRILSKPLSVQDAWSCVQTWTAMPNVWMPDPGEHHLRILDSLLSLPGVKGNVVHDAHLAAIAIEHGLTLCSADGDFAKFPGLRWIDPLAK